MVLQDAFRERDWSCDRFVCFGFVFANGGDIIGKCWAGSQGHDAYTRHIVIVQGFFKTKAITVHDADMRGFARAHEPGPAGLGKK